MKTLLIYNPNSGTGKLEKRVFKIKRYFEERNWHLDIYATKSREDLIDSSYTNADKYDRYLLMGGDGTMSLGIQGLMKSEVRPKILTIPTGTANDFSYMMGIKRLKLMKTLNLLEEERVRKTDVYKANDFYFIYAAAIGKFSEVSYKVKTGAKKKLGHLAYIMRGLKSIHRKVEFNLTVDANNRKVTMKSFLVFILAGKRVAGFNFKKLDDNIKLNDGKFEIVAFRRKSIFSWLKIFSVYLRRGKISKKDFKISASQATLHAETDYQWNFDGEGVENKPLNVTVANEAIEMYVSKKAEKIYY